MKRNSLQILWGVLVSIAIIGGLLAYDVISLGHICGTHVRCQQRIGALFGREGMQGMQGSELQSHTDILDVKSDLVSDENKPQMILFFMNGCPHCKNIESKWESFVRNNSGEDGKYHTRQFEVGKAPLVCRKFGVSSFPQYRELDAKGKVIGENPPF